MILLDGRKLSETRLHNLGNLVRSHQKRDGRRPGLAVVRVGEDPASQIYVRKKIKACEQVGFYSLEKHYPASLTEAELLEVIRELNENPVIDGILVQLPLPKGISESRILEAVSPLKDVDGFHPVNLGKLVAGKAELVACTPMGIMNLLHDYRVRIEGKRAVVVGRSRIVGRPISLLLDQAGATVTVVHSQTLHKEEIFKQAEILVVAVGKPHIVHGDQLQKGVAVVDVGINRLDANNPFGKPAGTVVGDVDFESASKVASAITPVPGGVGPMTICSLLENTWKSFLREHP